MDNVIMSGPGDKQTLREKAEKYIRHGGIAIEVGTWVGESAKIIATVCKDREARLVCIDAFGGNTQGYAQPQAGILSQAMARLAGLPVDFMVGNSMDIVRYIDDDLADFIFIDGDHNYPVVDSDIRYFWKKLKEGGGFLMHDYTNPCDVKHMCDKFFGEGMVTHLPDSMGFIEKP